MYVHVGRSTEDFGVSVGWREPVGLEFALNPDAVCFTFADTGTLYRLVANGTEQTVYRQRLAPPCHADTPDLDQDHDWWLWDDLGDGFFCAEITVAGTVHALYFQVYAGYINAVSDSFAPSAPDTPD